MDAFRLQGWALHFLLSTYNALNLILTCLARLQEQPATQRIKHFSTTASGVHQSLKEQFDA